MPILSGKVNIYQRFKRLTFWNKIAAFAATLTILSTIYGLFICYSQNKKLDDILDICSAAQEDPRLGSDVLEKKYPLGYAIFIIDGKRHSIDKCVESALFGKFYADWSYAAVIEFNENKISIRAPTIGSPDGKAHLIGRNNTMHAQRREHYRGCFISINEYQLWIEVINHSEDYSLGVLGIRSI